VFKSGDKWERGFARWLDEQHVSWSYEPCVLLLSNGRRYVPDFWVEEWKMFIELKGTHLDVGKAELARADGYNLVLLYGLDQITDFQEQHARA